eukprot:TRINITY_DN12717_c2_g1_i1.p1 TRINITY_DN12717_c2_g1~~TRINITY_DN12717_c2_g1_i1.p1  ORF type:complete len:997 (+),score=386.78 TRINITY_DN12717_c2_g1_i1:99-2993(+)
MGDGEAVQVAVRVRPFNQREKDADASLIIRMKNELKGSSTWVRNPKDGSEKKFDFDYSFQTHDKDKRDIGEFADQNKVFDTLGKPVLQDALEGKNICLFAYGQTGAGKSFSMLGKERSSDPSEQGIIPRTCIELFRKRDAERGNPLVEYQIYIQVVEIYCEQINDLLAPRKTWPKHGHKPKFMGPSQGYHVETVRMNCVDYSDIQSAFDCSNGNRSIGAHALNGESSRAHTIYMITYKRTEKASQEAQNATTITSHINLVDLAGSEKCEVADTRGLKSKYGGDMQMEGNYINTSLSALGNCIKVLSEAKKGQMVPYKDSKLTLLLQGAMTNGRVIMIAAVSPASINYSETISTLRFADRIKQVKIKASKNVTTDPVAQLQKEKEEMEKQMQAEIDKLKALLGGGTDELLDRAAGAAQRQKELEEQLELEKQARADMEAEIQRLKEEAERNKKIPSGERAELARKATLQLKQEWQRSMVDEGLRPAPRGPHLSNVNEDPRLCGLMPLALKDGDNIVGAQGPRTDCVLHGEGVQERHCVIRSTPDEIVLAEVSPGARVLVNGLRQTHEAIRQDGPKILRHNTRLWFGTSRGNVFVLVWPGQESDGEKDVGEDGVTYQLALNEAEKIEQLEDQKAEAAKAGDMTRAASLSEMIRKRSQAPAQRGGPTIQELEAMKAQAIEREDYEEAARVTRMLKAAAPSVEELKQLKQNAIAQDDFEEAKRLTELIKSREMGEQGLQTKGSWKAPGRLQRHADPQQRGAWPSQSSGGSPRDDGLPPLTQRDYQPATDVAGGANFTPRPGADVIPMTARTANAFRQRMMFIGRASVSLDFLVDPSGQASKFMTLPLDCEAGIQLGPDPPQLAVNVYQMQPQGQPPKRFALGERADFVVHVIGARGIPEMYSHTVFCKYVFKWGERDSYKTPELKNTVEPNFDFKKRFAFPKMTETLMGWFKQPGVLTFELIGIGQMA